MNLTTLYTEPLENFLSEGVPTETSLKIKDLIFQKLCHFSKSVSLQIGYNVKGNYKRDVCLLSTATLFKKVKKDCFFPPESCL